jgi:hypothetical protein
MYGIGRFCLALHDVVVHDMAVHDVGVPGVKMLRNISSKKVIFEVRFREEKTPIFP